MTGWLKRISYVDDDTDIRAVARLALEDVAGYNLQVCQSGSEALNVIPDFDPDVILLDHMMPGMDGVETYHALRRNPETSTTPIVFMTARARGQDADPYADLDIAGVIPKPFDPMSLAKDLEALWRRTLPVLEEA